MKPCAVIVWDRAASRTAGRMVTRACGAPAGAIIVARGDPIFAACHRHDARLRAAFPGIDLGRTKGRG